MQRHFNFVLTHGFQGAVGQAYIALGRFNTGSTDGFGDVVVWNPGEQLATRFGDLSPGDHRHFVCVEAAQIVQPVVLAPGERWMGMQRLG